MTAKRRGTEEMAAMRQLRRGTYYPKRTSFTEDDAAVLIPTQFVPPQEDAAVETEERRSSWLSKVRNRNSVAAKKGKVKFEIRYPENFNGLFSARFSPDGNYFVTAFGAGSMQVRYSETGDIAGTVRGANEHAFPVMCVRFLPCRNDTFFAASSCGSIFLCATRAGEYKKYAEEKNNEINALDINQASNTLVSAGKDTAVRVYDLNTGKVKTKYYKAEVDLDESGTLHFHRMRIFAVKFHPFENDTFLTGGWDDTVKIWDARVKEGCIRNIKGPHICGDAIDVFDKYVITGSWTVNNSLQLWDLTSGKIIDTITPSNRPQTIEGEFLYSVQYFAGDTYGDTVLTGGSGTGVVEVISLKDNRIISNFKIHKTVQAIDSTRDYMVFGGMESLIRIAEMDAY